MPETQKLYGQLYEFLSRNCIITFSHPYYYWHHMNGRNTLSIPFGMMERICAKIVWVWAEQEITDIGQLPENFKGYIRPYVDKVVFEYFGADTVRG